MLFRLGDFYEMFGPDAHVASAVLQITLTTRDKNKETPMPMCGIPYFAAENYIAKLVKAGHKVAICEQVEDPKDAKGIVRREVVRVVTPGTHTPENPKQSSYVMAIAHEGQLHGIALADISTGEFVLYDTAKPLEDVLTLHDPSEVLAPASLDMQLSYKEALQGRYVTVDDDFRFDRSEALGRLLRHFKVSSLEGFGCDELGPAISAAGALVAYLEDMQKSSVVFARLAHARTAQSMFLDAPTQRNLELIRNLKDGGPEGTLLWTLDQTLTSMGGRFLRQAVLSPLIDLQEIRLRQFSVKHLIEDYELTDRLRAHLRSIQDMERLGQRVATASANARDLVALAASALTIPKLRELLARSPDMNLNALGAEMGEYGEFTRLVGAAIEDHPPHTLRDGGLIKQGYNVTVDELRGLSTNAKDYIASLEATEREATGISSLKVGFNRIHGYYIEISKSNLPLAPAHYMRKQTLVGGERFITPELKEYETKVLGAEERLKGLEYEIFQDVLKGCAQWVAEFKRTSEALAKVDFLVSLAVCAKRNSYTMPVVSDDMSLAIKNGRHPVIERLPLTDRFIPNDTLMDGDVNRLLLITGPNMAGKSTYMRQVALIVLMAQVGSFVPAEEARIGIVDRIFTRIGASDYLTKGQSTFMVEMVETANILNNATDRSLIVLDEVGRGTSTFDGISIAWATAEHITTSIKSRTLFATHYNELTDLARAFDGIRNYNVSVKEWGDEVVFLRKIEPGPADKSYGIQVARLAGLPVDVVASAREVLKKLEKQHVSDVTSSANQMDLFSAQAASPTSALEEILAIDLEGLKPSEVVKRLKRIKKSLSP